MTGSSEEETKVEKVEPEAEEAAPEPTPAPEPEPQPTQEPPKLPKKITPSGGWVSVGTFCRYFDISDTYVRNLIKSGKVKGIQTIGGRYRIPRSEIERFEKELTFKPHQPQSPPPIRSKKRGEPSAPKEEGKEAGTGAKARAKKPEPKPDPDDPFD